MKPDTTICYIFRKKEPQFHSIETVFGIITPHIKKFYNIELQELGYGTARPLKIRKNLKTLNTYSAPVLFHITGHVNYMALRTGRNTVLTIHDIRSALRGNLVARMIKLVFWFWIPAIIVKRITVISEASRKEFLKMVPFSRRKTTVVPNPVHPDFTFQRKDKLPNQPARILLMGTKPNKNLERIVDALHNLPVKLIIIGKLSASQQSQLEKSDLEYEAHHDISPGKIIECYHYVDLLCFASLYEGFGMPIIEAQATGLAVITSNRGATKEVAGDGAHFVEPENVESIREGVLKVLGDSTYRMHLVELGLENVKRFRSDIVAERYLQIYRDLIGNSGE